jgi:hypothetical protein
MLLPELWIVITIWTYFLHYQDIPKPKFVRITGCVEFIHRSEFQVTRKHNVLDTQSSSSEELNFNWRASSRWDRSCPVLPYRNPGIHYPF